jgi:hypothetical protein
MRYLAIAFLAFVALRAEAGEHTGSALRVSGKRGATDHHVWNDVNRIVRLVARAHHLSPAPTNPNRPDYVLNEKDYYSYYPSASRTNISLFCERLRDQPIEIEIVESGARRPSRAHLALLRDLRSGLSKSGLLVTRGIRTMAITD